MRWTKDGELAELHVDVDARTYELILSEGEGTRTITDLTELPTS
jgi:hypothetical protein